MHKSDESRHPLIVLEGLDGCGKLEYSNCVLLCNLMIFIGKSSTGKRFAKQIGALQWKTPPESIGHLRHLFDNHKELRTAYYSLGNYIAALEVQELLKMSPVLMDR